MWHFLIQARDSETGEKAELVIQVNELLKKIAIDWVTSLPNGNWKFDETEDIIEVQGMASEVLNDAYRRRILLNYLLGDVINGKTFKSNG